MRSQGSVLTGKSWCVRPCFLGNIAVSFFGSRRHCRLWGSGLVRARISLGHHRRRFYGRPDPVDALAPVHGSPSIDAIVPAQAPGVNANFRARLSPRVRHRHHPLRSHAGASPSCHYAVQRPGRAAPRGHMPAGRCPHCLHAVLNLVDVPRPGAGRWQAVAHLSAATGVDLRLSSRLWREPRPPGRPLQASVFRSAAAPRCGTTGAARFCGTAPRSHPSRSW